MGVAERQLWVFAFHAAAGRGDKGRSKQAVQKVIVRFSSSSTPFGLWDHRIAQPIQCCEDYSLSVGRPKNGDVLSSICCAAGQRYCRYERSERASFVIGFTRLYDVGDDKQGSSRTVPTR